MALRGVPDSVIRERLNSEELLFLTHDSEFLDIPPTRSTVILSRVTQSLPIEVRMKVWSEAIREFSTTRRTEKLFEVFDDGKLSIPGVN